MADKAEILAAVEMANEGLGVEVLIDLFHRGGERLFVRDGFTLPTPGGPVTIVKSKDGKTLWTVI